MENIQRAMCNIEGNLMYLIFDIKKLVKINKWLHESYLNNNEDIHKLKIKKDKLLERFQDTCSSSYVSDCHMVDYLEDYHGMMDHEKHGKIQVTHFLNKCMIPPPWNQPMVKVLHF